MDIAIVTGSGGLIGSEACEFLLKKGFHVIGIDNNMREKLFGEEASVQWNIANLHKNPLYTHYSIDIRNHEDLYPMFYQYNNDIKLILHAAAQPSHDWASKAPVVDFSINVYGTLNLLEFTREFCSKACFIFCSTNKVYGDNPNKLDFIELEKRWECTELYNGISEEMSIDNCTHSLFGVSKASADLMVQEYGKYFGMNTVCFRGGCLTGGKHSGTKLHGFLSYLMKCHITQTPYEIIGYKGKQVRDNINSYDFIKAMYEVYLKPKQGEVYNMGGGRENSCSVLEAIDMCENIVGRKIEYKIKTEPRIGDHKWYISDIAKFEFDYPNWYQEFTLKDTLIQIYNDLGKRI